MKIYNPDIISDIRTAMADMKNAMERIENVLPTFEREFTEEQAERALDEIINICREQETEFYIDDGNGAKIRQVDRALSSTVDFLLEVFTTNVF